MHSPILDRLRHGTADIHAHLDSALPLAGDHLDPTEYVRLLAAFRSIQAQADRALAPHAHALRHFGYDVNSRHEVEWLDADLVWWKEQRGIVPPGAVPEPASASAFPAITSTSEAAGCVYVLEGSTLGGQVILRHIEKSLCLDPPVGCRYFASYGEDVGPRWRRTCQTLDDIAASWPSSQTAIETEKMVAAARALFTHIDTILNQALV